MHSARLTLASLSMLNRPRISPVRSVVSTLCQDHPSRLGHPLRCSHLHATRFNNPQTHCRTMHPRSAETCPAATVTSSSAISSFPPIVDQCPRWLCLLLISWIRLVLTHYTRLHCLPLSTEVASECVSSDSSEHLMQLTAVQQPPHPAVAISSSRISHDSLRPFPTLPGFVASTLPRERPKLC